MHRPMSSRERLLLTLTVCLTLLVLGPLTALAATGQLVNIVDPTNASRAAVVTEIGALQVQTRPGIPANSFSGRSTRSTTGWAGLYTVPSGRRTAIVEATFSSRASSAEVLVSLGVATVPLANSCIGTNTGITTGAFSRTFYVPAGVPVQVDFSGQPIVLGLPASGMKHCVGVLVGSTDPFTINVGVSGYTFVP